MVIEARFGLMRQAEFSSKLDEPSASGPSTVTLSLARSERGWSPTMPAPASYFFGPSDGYSRYTTPVDVTLAVAGAQMDSTGQYADVDLSACVAPLVVTASLTPPVPQYNNSPTIGWTGGVAGQTNLNRNVGCSPGVTTITASLGINLQAKIIVRVNSKLNPKSITFADNIQITRDQPYSSPTAALLGGSTPEWLSTNSSVSNQPAAYVKGSVMHLKVNFGVEVPGTQDQSVLIEGQVSGLGTFRPQTNSTLIPARSTETGIIDVFADGTLPLQTKFFNPMSINWRHSTNGGVTWTSDATTTHKVYDQVPE